jgi:hypothetical protein
MKRPRRPAATGRVDAKLLQVSKKRLAYVGTVDREADFSTSCSACYQRGNRKPYKHSQVNIYLVYEVSVHMT